MLTESVLWERVRRLEIKTVYTITRKIPNKISRVTDNRVEIEGRVSRIYRRQILRVYHTLREDGVVTGTRNLTGWSVIMAILHKVLPDETEEIKGEIRLKSLGNQLG